MGIKLITIDFWNTIFDSSGGKERNSFRQRSLVEVIDKLGVFVDGEKFNGAMQASWDFFNNIWINEQRTPDPKDTVKFFWDYLSLPFDQESQNKIVKDFANSILVHKPKIIDGAKDAIIKLSEEYKIALVSDTGFSPGTILKALLEDQDILKYFDAFSFSDETGVAKPQKQAFEKVLNELNIMPEESVHIGDIEFTDVKGAKSIGMYSIRFNGDPTAFLGKDDSVKSIADYEVGHWNQVYNIVKIIDSKL